MISGGDDEGDLGVGAAMKASVQAWIDLALMKAKSIVFYSRVSIA